MTRSICALLLGALFFSPTAPSLYAQRSYIRPVSVSCSNESRLHAASAAFDGSRRTFWSAGRNPTQWIEADLGRSRLIKEVRFNVSLTRDATTTWEVWICDHPIGDRPRGAKLVERIRGMTSSDETIRIPIREGAKARYIQIRNTQSPFWTALNEIWIIGPRGRVNQFIGGPSRKPLINPQAVACSDEYRGYPGKNVFDGDLKTIWSSGRVPTQWLEADLGSSVPVSEIRFCISITRKAATSWEVLISDRPIRRGSRESRLVKRFTKVTERDEVIVVEAPSGTQGRYIQIRNTRSPFWTALSEVVFLGPGPRERVPIGLGTRAPVLSPVRVDCSREHEEYLARNAFDGDVRSFWSAGQGPTQWIEADLGQSRGLSEVRFSVSIAKRLPTSWEVWVSDRPIRSGARGARLVKRINELTERDEIISVPIDARISARYVQIRNTKSSVWTALNEVAILGRGQREVPRPVPVPARFPIVGTWRAANPRLGPGAIVGLTVKEVRDGKLQFEFQIQEARSARAQVVTRIVDPNRGLSYDISRVKFVRRNGRFSDVKIGFFVAPAGRGSLKVSQAMDIRGRYVTSPENILSRSR